MSQPSVILPPLAGAAIGTSRNMFSGWVCNVQTWLTRRSGWRELASLDDHLLQDVGFSREDLSPEGRQAVLPAHLRN
jgi:uncharacterized protein YjiS (DUF1127 family)